MSTEEKKVEEQISAGDVAVVPVMIEPDMTYRNSPCFVIDKKEFRELTKNNKIPSRVTDYKTDSKNVYVRYGTHLTFNINNFLGA